MKRFFSVIVFTFLALNFWATTPEEVLENARTKTNIKTMASEAQVNIQKPIGTTIGQLLLRQYTGKDVNNRNASMIIFLGPAKYKNTRFLMIERDNGSNDQRVFLPSMRKSRRIAAEAEGKSAFFGTDFSYNDIAFMSRAIKLDNHKFLPDEKYSGEDCYVIESVPKDQKESSYAKTVSKIAKSTNLLLCATFYDKDNNEAKFIELLDYKNVNGIETPMNVKMTTYSTKSSTVISIRQIKYNLPIPAGVFTQRYLETGR